MTTDFYFFSVAKLFKICVNLSYLCHLWSIEYTAQPNKLSFIHNLIHNLIKTMRVKDLFKVLLLCLGLSFAVTGCDDYDDSALREEIENINGEISDIKSRLETLEGQIASVQAVIDAQKDGKVVTNVEAKADGKTYVLTFNDGTNIEVVRGNNESQVTVVDIDGATYWAVMTNGEAEPIRNSAGDMVPFLYGADYLSVDAEGYWLLEGERVLDGNGDYVKLTTDGAIFTDITIEEDCIIFTLPDHEVVIPRKTGTFLTFENAVENPYSLYAGRENQIPVRISADMQLVEVIAHPEGWTVELNRTEGYVAVTPLLSADRNETYEVRLQGMDENGLVYLAVARIQLLSIDFSDPNGVFILNEGNMSSGNGSLIYIDGEGNVMDNVYKSINGSELGNSVQDLCIADGKMYIISQNGNRNGGDGRLVVADSKTMERVAAYNDELSTLSRPTHVAVLDEENIFIRDGAGVYRFNSATGELTFVEGSDKAKQLSMAIIGDKVFAPVSQGVLVLEAGQNAVSGTISFEGKVSGVVKSGDGNIFVSTISPAQIAKVNSGTYEIIKTNDVTLGSLSAGWGATPGITAIGDILYYSGASTTIYRHDFTTGESKLMIDAKDVVGNAKTVYNNIAVHPLTGRVYLNTIKGYGTDYLINNISVFRPEGDALALEANYENHTRFPAGIFFPANFR